MALRFRKSIKLAPGIRMNFSSRGTSWTIGPRGASIGVGQRGTYLNTSVAGFSSRQRIGGETARGASRAAFPNGSTTMSISVSVSDEGEITFRDDKGNLLSEDIVTIAKKQQGEMICGLIQKKCDEINAQIEVLGNIHLYTPAGIGAPSYKPLAYDVPIPAIPVPKRPNFLTKWFKRIVAGIEARNAHAQILYEQASAAWATDKIEFDRIEAAKRDLVASAVAGNVVAMEIFLENTLQEIVWPRETDMSFDILNGGTKIAIDVDLPEIEDMPNRTASVPQRGYRLSVKEINATQIQKNYMWHVHAVGFRIIGEAFAALPTVQEVMLSAYSQRPSKATGQIGDEYLYSVCVSRAQWSAINFNNLSHLDVVESLAQFELRREMSKTGVFRAIQPLTA